MKIKKFLGGVIGSLSGISSIRKGNELASKIAHDKLASVGLEAIKEAGALLNKKGNGKAETFQSACCRQGIGEAELLNIRTSLTSSSRFYRVGTWLCILCGLLSFLAADSLYWYVLYLLNCGAVACLVGAFAARDTFRLWQVENRELASFNDFVNSGGIIKAIAGGG